ncbi:uncharacterized protein LOC112668079 [Canis lupus dingo]|uniref:uncharacterized protein LOC112668079 n=1 Tax=Canis lupus dingo TaxID=286419 RepID=UPI000BAA2542|nr:uncharacterized protein LOC112668079 [Canis lupus dingo]|eukprot:XP_022270396.1 uncharacterized protein LOC111094195 [Canis lupus familiaris]
MGAQSREAMRKILSPLGRGRQPRSIRGRECRWWGRDEREGGGRRAAGRVLPGRVGGGRGAWGVGLETGRRGRAGPLKPAPGSRGGRAYPPGLGDRRRALPPLLCAARRDPLPGPAAGVLPRRRLQLPPRSRQHRPARERREQKSCRERQLGFSPLLRCSRQGLFMDTSAALLVQRSPYLLSECLISFHHDPVGMQKILPITENSIITSNIPP